MKAPEQLQSPAAESSPADDAALLRALQNLLESIEESKFPLDTADAQAARTRRSRLRDQLADYLIPRVTKLDAPLLAVVGGSTGAGKSTLVNSLVGREVSPSGVLRPTTRSPVLVHHPDDAPSFDDDRILPNLARVLRSASDGENSSEGSQPGVRLISDVALSSGLAVLDAPDIDSVLEANRTLAGQLLAAADLWIFVTTASRYADAVPWDLLKASARRGTTVAMVLDRVPAEASREVRHHLSELLVAAGLESTPLFTIPELSLQEGLLPEAAVFPVKSWVLNLGSNPRARALVVRRTLHGALSTIPDAAEDLAAAAASQHEARLRLAVDVDEEFDAAQHNLNRSLADGRVLRGEVLARWQDFVGTGQFFRGIEPTVSRLRDRITAAIGGKRDSAGPLGEAMKSAVAALIREQAVEALSASIRRWRVRPEGEALLAGNPAIGALSDGFDREVTTLLQEWHDDVNTLVREEGQGARAKARILSFGIHGVGVVLMLAVFSGTGEPDSANGEEPENPAGTVAVAQRLLEEIFGDQVMRELSVRARAGLRQRIEAVIAGQRKPFDNVLEPHAASERKSGRLRDAGRELQEAL
ncbi:dynamin family protein [Saxibacter everestensis]|uniref:Dynamin family protein n=1 Tax=Saxibacter everestensis TaxID=2909229 RepID=A0ABY8QNC7_9MICO|nr:dynamin family protein [Brevibacteriaceae bacterium ZFBP1038]